MTDRTIPTSARHGLLRVPGITVYFWIVKSLSTAMGESASDYLVNTIDPVVAVAIGFFGFVAALIWQFTRRRYTAPAYWLAVVMVGVFGTMAADVMHVGLGVPYPISTTFYLAALAAVFLLWQHTEKTLSIHTVDSTRREAFYWAAVVATFALGTAAGDLTAMTLHLGYLLSAVLFAVVISIPILGYRFAGWNPIFAFWFAYVITRPLGASFADWLGKPTTAGGLGLGDGPVTLALTLAIVGFVTYLTITRRDIQQPSAHATAVRPTETDTVVLPASPASPTDQPLSR
jgi:uncharacterized membrane-anchored protein